ncbi:MAG: hypothetical protein QXW52_08665 [Candidatus Caldarchaeum sp.]
MTNRKLDEFLPPDVAQKVVQAISKALISGQAPSNPRIYRDPDSEYYRQIERIVVDEVYTWFESRAAPVFRDTLIELVQRRILGRKAQGLWCDSNGNPLPVPSYDTVRRRVNAACEARYYDGKPPCLMVADTIVERAATFYFPNPASLPPDKAAQVSEVLKKWRVRK